MKYYVNAMIPFSPSNDFLLPIQRKFAKQFFDTEQEAEEFIKEMKKRSWKVNEYGGEIFGFELKFEIGKES